MSDSARPHRRQPTRLRHPWDSPGKNSGLGCHFLLQCMKVKSESEVTQSCPTLCYRMDCSLPGSSVHGIFQARVLDWGAVAFSEVSLRKDKLSLWMTASASAPELPACQAAPYAPYGADGANEPSCQCRKHQRCGFNPWVGKVLWRRKWQPTLVFLPGKSHGLRSLMGLQRIRRN